jgi:hypothetical protein
MAMYGPEPDPVPLSHIMKISIVALHSLELKHIARRQSGRSTPKLKCSTATMDKRL